MQAEIDSFKAQLLNLQSTVPKLSAAVAVSPLIPPFTVNDVVHKLNLRSSKEVNLWYFLIY